MGNMLNSDSIVVFTDVSEEIDDQLFLNWIHINADFNGTFTIVFCPTNHNTSEHGKQLWTEKYLPHTLKTKKDVITSWSTFKYMTLEEFSIIPSVTYDYAIVIAPLKGYSGNNLNVDKKVFIQGSEIENSFNTISSSVFISKFKEQGKLIEIPSSKCAIMRPTSKWLRSLPKFYQDQVAIVGFKLLMGRMGTKITNSGGMNISQTYSEGLINPEVKPIASNYNATRALLTIKTTNEQTPEGLNIDEIVPDNIHVTVANKYMADVFGDDTSLAQDYEGSVVCLGRMCKAIDIITDVDMFTERGEVYYSDFGEDFNGDRKLRAAFGSFKSCLQKSTGAINFLNPVYDLFAGMVAVEYIKTQRYYDGYTVDEFFKKVM